MTKYSVEKFYDEYALKKEGTVIAILDSGTNAKKVCALLNKQEEQIKDLKCRLNSIYAILREEKCGDGE